MIIHSFIQDIIQLGFLQRALITAVFIGIVTGVLGSFIILSGMSLMGEAISHAILPGVVISYIIGINNFLGAIVAGLFATFLMSRISRNSKLKSDVSIGIIFSSFFALGIVLLLKAQTAINLTQILFGNVLTITKENMYLTLIIGSIVLVLVFVFYKAFLITIFDPEVASSYGFNVKLFHHLLMALLTFVIVASLQAVGVVLVVSMLITPAATAYLLTDKFKQMIFLSAGIGALGSVIGLYISFRYDLSSGGVIVLVLAALFALAYLFSPTEGIVIKAFRKGDGNE